jgi:hypothetical protein
MHGTSDGGTRRSARLRRAFRWQPGNHAQTWLLAAGAGLVVAVVPMALGRPLSISLPAGILSALSTGALGSYRLQRRQDAGVVADWADSPHQMKPPETRG